MKQLRNLCVCTLTILTVSTLNAQQQPDNSRDKRAEQIWDFFSSKSGFRGDRSKDTKPEQTDATDEIRSIDGSGNNVGDVTMGTSGTPNWRLAPAAYDDGAKSPSGRGLLSARVISNLVCDQTESIPNQRFLTDMVWQWGQFVDHDLDLTETSLPLVEFPINVPKGDIFFDPFSIGDKQISLFRSEFAAGTGKDASNPREQVNAITAWIDGSNVYGSDAETAANLRLFRRGLLRRNNQNLLPQDDSGFYLAGDVRANEQVGLTAMHTLFMREHNRIARAVFERDPMLSDEQIYQIARRDVIAVIQAITYNEFLPALLGPDALRPYKGYRASESCNVSNEFATAAYRFGHSMLNSQLQRINSRGQSIADGPIALQDAFFNPSLLATHGIDPYLRGLASQQAQEIDPYVIDDVRNFLFGQPGSGGFDLASLNIQRGRDHGLPGYNMLRVSLGMRPADSFRAITSDPARQVALELAYNDVDNVEPWIGILSEDHMPGASVGRTAYIIIRDQFQRCRDADRYWCELEFDGAALNRIEKTTLANVIRRNTSIRNIQANVFFMPNAQPDDRHPSEPPHTPRQR